MALTVIGAGFGRTGTKSIKLALEQLGLGPCHHMAEVFTNPAQLPFWQAAAAGEAIDWADVFQGYKAAIDWPSAHYWRELAEYYPAEKVILSVRPAERWWDSFNKTIRKAHELRREVTDPHVRGILEMSTEIIEEQTFGGGVIDKATALRAFEKRITDVRATVASNRLLVFDVTEGWVPLCRFLNSPIPDEPFPRTNSVDEFWEKFSVD